eukprot:g9145.t1
MPQGMGDGMKEDWIAYIVQQTLQGLKYLHDRGQIHRDIKAGNILLGEDGRVKLADFGVAGWLVGYGNRRNVAKTFVGTPCWMAPEVMEQVGGYNQKADIWSIGITALELAKGHAPYARLEPMMVLMQTIEREPPSLESYPDDRQPGGDVFGCDFKEVVRFCLQKNPKARPNCASLLSKKFFNGDLQPDSIVTELLVDVPALGGADETFRRREPGVPAAVLLEEPMMLDIQTAAKPSSSASEAGEGDEYGRPKLHAARKEDHSRHIDTLSDFLNDPLGDRQLLKTNGIAISDVDELDYMDKLEAELARSKKLEAEKKLTDMPNAVREEAVKLLEVVGAKAEEVLRAPARELHMPLENWTESLLETHEEFVQRLRKMGDRAAPIVEKVKKREELVQKREYADSFKVDYRARGAAGIHSQAREVYGIKKEVKEKLPILTAALREELGKWQNEEGFPFRYNGREYLKTIEDSDMQWQHRKETSRSATKDVFRSEGGGKGGGGLGGGGSDDGDAIYSRSSVHSAYRRPLGDRLRRSLLDGRSESGTLKKEGVPFKAGGVNSTPTSNYIATPPLNSGSIDPASCFASTTSWGINPRQRTCSTGLARPHPGVQMSTDLSDEDHMRILWDLIEQATGFGVCSWDTFSATFEMYQREIFPEDMSLMAAVTRADADMVLRIAFDRGSPVTSMAVEDVQPAHLALFLGRFGPMKSCLVKAARSLFDKSGCPVPWFHGKTSREQATRAIVEWEASRGEGQKQPGVFLFRYTDSRPEICVSYRSGKGLESNLRHTLVENGPQGYLLGGNLWPDLQKCIEENRDSFVHPVPSALYVEWKQEIETRCGAEQPGALKGGKVASTYYPAESSGRIGAAAGVGAPSAADGRGSEAAASPAERETVSRLTARALQHLQPSMASPTLAAFEASESPAGLPSAEQDGANSGKEQQRSMPRAPPPPPQQQRQQQPSARAGQAQHAAAARLQRLEGEQRMPAGEKRNQHQHQHQIPPNNTTRVFLTDPAPTLHTSAHEQLEQPKDLIPVSNVDVSRSLEDPSSRIVAEEADNVADDAPLTEVTLSHSLGPNHATYVSTSHGVELEVQAGALSEEVHLPVTVSPRLQFVDCPVGGLGTAPVSEDDCATEEFLAMTFVHGPEEASFQESKPAKLRFFLGYVDEFAPSDGSNQAVDDRDIERHVLETYRPLTSPDGVKGWTVLGQYTGTETTSQADSPTTQETLEGYSGR